jgi:excisionase family DNA binding protein
MTATETRNGREVSVGIRWRTGAAEQHTIQRPPSINDKTRTSPETVDLIKRLAPGRTNTEIVDRLNAARLRTGKGLPFNDHAVRHIRRAHNIPTTPSLPGDRGLTVTRVAERLGISPGVIYDWISHNKLVAHHTQANRLRIPFSAAIEQDCRERIANSSHIPQTRIAATGGAV